MTEGLEPAAEISRPLEQFLSQRENNTESQSLSQTREPECPDCDGTGYCRGAGGMRECACVAERRVISRLPPRFKCASLADFSPDIQNFVLDWFRDPRDGLLITGSVGTGKTHLLAAMARTLLLANQSSVFFRGFDKVYRSLRECYREDRSEEDVLSDYTAPRWLFLDDLGAGGLSDFERRTTLEILNDRFGRMLPTAISTNWSIEEIAEKMDERIASRLGSLTGLELRGEDRRQSEPACSSIAAGATA